MTTKSTTKHFLLLHFIIFIWGWTPILGRAISLQALPLVWHRMWIAVVAVFLYLLFKKVKFIVSTKSIVQFAGVGIIIVLHWLCFYGAIKASNVSVTMACFSCGALFTAFIEPFFLKRKINYTEVFFGILAVLALSIIFSIDSKYRHGMGLAILAALGSAIFSVLNSLLVQKQNAYIISFYELLFGFIGLTIAFIFTPNFQTEATSITSSDFLFLLLLGIVCTAFPFIVSVNIMKYISPYTVNLSVNLESVYGIILAYFIFGNDEKMNLRFYIGTGIILAILVANALVKKYRNKGKNESILQ